LRAILPVLFLLTPAVHAVEQAAVPQLPKKKATAISLLPNGSELDGVMLPRYDSEHRLAGVLKSRKMTLVTDELIAGEDVSIEFFNPDRSPRGRVDLLKALFNQNKGLLEARESVTIRSDRILAIGTGLTYAFGQGEGFLSGPASTRILQAPTETTMNSSSTPLRSAAVSMLASATLIAAPPAALSEDDKAAIQADAAPAAPTHATASREAKEELRATLDASAAATAAATAFLEEAELAAGKTDAVPEPAAPLDVKPGPGDTIITCDGGMYFDADEGVFVYLKNVRVADPRFTLSGANELKVFLGKKPAASTEKTTTAEKPATGLGAKLGDVERIVATGAVRILQKQPEAGKEPVEASGAIFTYHVGSGEIVLSGGYPWVKQGNSFMRAKQPNLNLRIHKNGSFVTEGNWEMGGNLNQNR
jgi:lipopolysaccharide export system protein LptA